MCIPLYFDAHVVHVPLLRNIIFTIGPSRLGFLAKTGRIVFTIIFFCYLPALIYPILLLVKEQI
jgi:hypothetical protein